MVTGDTLLKEVLDLTVQPTETESGNIEDGKCA